MVLTLFVHVIAFHVFSPTTCHQSISTSPCFLLPCQLLYSMQVVINLSLAWPQPSRSGGVGACQLALGSRGVGVVSCAARMPPKKVAAPVLTEPTGVSSASGSGKRPAVPDATNDVTVPAKAAKVQAPAVVVLVKPKLPKAVGSARELPAKQMMRKIVPWVNQELEKFLHRELMLKHHENLRDLKPLSVSAKEKDAVGTSYKQPWVPENAKLSMTLNGLYEAGAVLSGSIRKQPPTISRCLVLIRLGVWCRIFRRLGSIPSGCRGVSESCSLCRSPPSSWARSQSTPI